MEFGFKQTCLTVSTGDGRNCTLLEPLTFVRKDGSMIRIRAGATTDGASTPPELWVVEPPFGKRWFSYIIHDGAYRNTLELLRADHTWIPITLNEEQANELLRECMESQGSTFEEREAFFLALNEFGEKAFEEDRKPVGTSGR